MRRFAHDAIRSLIAARESLGRSTRARPPALSWSATQWVAVRSSSSGSLISPMPFPCACISTCLTGDVYGSRRGDCGEQFRLALALLEDLGDGGILYLAEEGRGLGLANKMRTCQAGIEVASGIPLEVPINAHNRRYMTAKAARAEHRFDQLTASLADQSELGRVVQFKPYALPVI
jgi:hypothetical protein